MASTQAALIRKTIKTGKKAIQRLALALQKPKADVYTLVQQISDECRRLLADQAELNAALNNQSEDSVLSKAAKRLGKVKSAPAPVDTSSLVCVRCGHTKAEHDRHGCGHTEKSDNLTVGCDCPEFTPRDEYLEGIMNRG